MSTPPKPPKGILNAWQSRQEAEPLSFEEQLQAKVRDGKTPVAVQGRQYQLLITLPVAFKKKEDIATHAPQAAMHILGEFLARTNSHSLRHLLHTQKLSFTESDIIGPCVSFQLGAIKLYAAASSSNEELAQAMAIDRLALALTRAKQTIPNITQLMTAHYLEIVRNT